MYSGGTTQAHNNRYTYPDDSDFDSIQKVSWAAKVYKAAAATATAEKFIFGKMHNSNQGGFNFRSANGDKIKCLVHNGSGGSTQLSSSVAFADDTAYSVVARHDGAANTLRMEIDGLEVLAPSTSSNQDPGDSATFGLCSHSGLNGAVYYIGQCMIWPEYVLSDAEVAEYHAGVNVPAAAALGFWDKCIAEGPTVEQIRAATGTEVNAITLFSDDVDSMFSGQGFLLPHRQLAGYNIRILACSPEVYKLRVPQEYAALALGSEALIADGDLPAASSLLSSLDEHFMLDDWRAMNAVILEGNIEPNGDLSILVFNRMPAMCFFWQTGALDKGVLVNAAEEGTASIVPWAVMTNDRNSQHYILDATEDTSRVRLASVGRFASKINHRGTLFEPAYENLVKNSAFLVDGAGPPTFVDTTESLGTGGAVNAVDASTIPMLFTEEKIQGNAVRAAEIVKGSAGDAYLEWDLGIDTSGDDARVLLWHRGLDGNYAIQRTSDSNWWSSGSTWGASISWKALAADEDEWQREITALIQGMPTSGTLKLRIGIEAGTGLEGDQLYLAQSMAYQHWAILSDIVSLDGASVTSEADDEVWDIDNGGTHDAQTFNPNRGTVRARLRFETDSADIPDDTWGTVSIFGVDANNYDHLLIGKSGSSFTLAHQRVISGVQDAIASKALSAYTRGDELEVAGRWTDTRGVELSLSARTLSVFEAGTKGTDDQATGIHSTSDQTTFLRWGNPHSGAIGAGIFPLTFAYVKNMELVQWAIPDEGISARRVAA